MELCIFSELFNNIDQMSLECLYVIVGYPLMFKYRSLSPYIFSKIAGILDLVATHSKITCGALQGSLLGSFFSYDISMI